MKTTLKRFVPKPITSSLGDYKRAASVCFAYGYDLWRYLRYSSTFRSNVSAQNLRGKITATYHNIEKGLSLPNPRPGFGTSAIGRLLDLLDIYSVRYGVDVCVETSLSVLQAYLDFNATTGLHPENIPHFSRIRKMLDAESFHVRLDRPVTGTRKVSKARVLEAASTVGLDFFATRNSVRQFSQDPVELADLEFAARAAQHAPSVCNRQFGKVYTYLDPNEIAQILSIQGGANGFGQGITGLAIVTSGLRNYWEAGERAQAWTDGGLFSMNFILGLHSRGIGSVCLNWSKSPRTDRRLRSVIGLPDDEAIVMLIGFGHLLEDYSVAASPRMSLDQTLIVK